MHSKTKRKRRKEEAHAYSTKEIAPLVGLTTGAIYARMEHLRKKLKAFKR